VTSLTPRLAHPSSIHLLSLFSLSSLLSSFFLLVFVLLLFCAGDSPASFDPFPCGNYLLLRHLHVGQEQFIHRRLGAPLSSPSFLWMGGRSLSTRSPLVRLTVSDSICHLCFISSRPEHLPFCGLQPQHESDHGLPPVCVCGHISSPQGGFQGQLQDEAVLRPSSPPLHHLLP